MKPMQPVDHEWIDTFKSMPAGKIPREELNELVIAAHNLQWAGVYVVDNRRRSRLQNAVIALREKIKKIKPKSAKHEEHQTS